MTVNLNDLAARYIQLRDQKEARQKEHKAELKPVNDEMTQLENQMLSYLNEVGAESFRTSAGTVFKEEKSSATVVDFPAVWDYAIQTNNQELIEKRVSKTMVEEIIKETGECPPGVNYTRMWAVKVHRS